MAKATEKNDEKKTGTEVAAAGTTAVTTVAPVNFAEDAGSGMEGTTQESFAIPFLSVLQKGSPQVDEASGVAIEGAKSGMFFDNISGKMFDGKGGVTIVPCAYRRVFLRWTPRGMPGSGFKGEMTPEEVATLRSKGQIVEMEGKLYVPMPDGTVNDKRCDRIADTRNHYVLLVTEDGAFKQALVSLTSTQIKKSKALMSMLADIKIKGTNGMYTPATFANQIKATSVPESNDKGNWHGWKFDHAGMVDRGDIYAAGKAFNDTVKKGQVVVKYEDVDGEPGAASPGAGKEGF